nr:restriction endonuclease subunit S [uncultured Sellimonas sp.]
MFKMFKVGELFDIHPTSAYKMKNDELFASDGKTPVLSNSSVNNGIGGYCGLAPTEQGGMITFSDTTTGADTMFYQSSPFIGYPHVQGMYPYQPDKWDEKCCLYVISCIRKSAGNGWNYAVKFNRALVKELSIELPVVESTDADHEYTVDDIDYEYMQERIAEFEQERITELDAYLAASGLDDYELTDEDKEILSLFPESASDEAGASEADCEDGQIAFKVFKVSDVFNKVEAKCKKANFDKRRDTATVPNEEYCVPLVNAKVGDNGIMFYGRKSDWNTQEMCIDVIQNGAVATGTVYAQPQPVGCFGMHI